MAAAETALATTSMAPLPVELGAQVELVGREGVVARGRLAQSETAGWIRLITEESAGVFVRESEIVIIRKIE
jgi:hypothetical protein